MIKFSIRPIGIILATLCFILFSDFLFSQTKISGVASFAKSQKMRVQTYDDLISYKIKTIKEVQLDRMGKFDFEINIQKPTYLFFVINFINGQLMIEPDKNMFWKCRLIPPTKILLRFRFKMSPCGLKLLNQKQGI